MKNDFEYKYIAPTSEERKEIESIRNSYITKEKSISKLDHLRKLDNKVKELPQLISLIDGIVGILLFGLGLTMILEWSMLIWGIVVCIVLLVPIALAYPIYNIMTKRLKEKYSEEIIQLSNELLNQKQDN